MVARGQPAQIQAARVLGRKHEAVDSPRRPPAARPIGVSEAGQRTAYIADELAALAVADSLADIEEPALWRR